MPKEAGQQQYCITIDRDQVPSISVLEAVSEVALLGAIRLVELLPYIDAKNDETFQKFKSDVKKIIAMAIMSLEVRFVKGRGWEVPEDHPMVDPLSLEEMKSRAIQIHQI
ncbi:hypothetical protein A3A54_00700 [Candidatus Curtissbacteria bacterium RIFCSPLOWO2_01_FULL_39_62]|uniref:Uncharacterized protein n=2 Tax=Candidatus Curtissiibacteriota TaxID=1752717 RepID=A0A1F5G7P2_9BACT|nr:MAG: hypothetical protein A2775_02635 [Candidatus Curtissbacteria bacterium RIFCSPHIGHO2_01_FULL_39_57]OGD87835.1 MAG: hypothetical protein A3D04_02605 [Candidatus Curtissbacteria bacterium RIFCSPHIGHO2_02_FULL_40_16b]OGD90588.1 MAG: hypothetical protein A3E11_02125 [Candidatus Curtissbacteria bacterium RIFCSPHIGHO2_12_FULL_38_37]OGD99795.1 MAG: hypothetical protein A3J17_04400 [Candidatus Curtissbacteria bacterium RIFCSPLOWO2_02_FULL_40_11]OGE01098.1 MAG: hypothetical protein A3A54_00700 [C